MITDAVSCILHKDRVIRISQGDKNFQLCPDESITLPGCVTRCTLQICGDPISLHFIPRENAYVGRSRIYYLIRDRTVSNKDIVTSVDYLQILLVAELVEVLQEIIDSIIPTDAVNKLSHYLLATSTFHKNRYNYHITVQ